jgi:hypothetical protein
MGNSRSPEETCEEFFDKLADKEYEAAKKYTSGATDAYLDLLKEGMNIFAEMNQAGQNFKGLAQVDDEDNLTYNCTVEGDQATCACTHKSNETLSYNFNLIKENGQWVIHQPKETVTQ